MSISDFLSGLLSNGNSAAAPAPSTTPDRGPQSPETVVCECRHCGTTVSIGTTHCPACESEEIAVYQIE